MLVSPPMVDSIAVAAVAVVAVPCPTFRRRIRSICRSCVWDIYDRPGMREHRAVDLPWIAKG